MTRKRQLIAGLALAAVTGCSSPNTGASTFAQGVAPHEALEHSRDYCGRPEHLGRLHGRTP